MTEIYVICTYSERGRYLADVALDRARATVAAERLAEGYANDGYTYDHVQQVHNNRRFADVPNIMTVHHLRRGGDWVNVELYAARDTHEPEREQD